MRASTADLIAFDITYDELRQAVKTEIKTSVMVEVKSVTRAEWDAAGRHGHKPQIVLITPRFNYSEETAVDFEGKRYEVYRTFANGDNIELYLELRGGSDGNNNG